MLALPMIPVSKIVKVMGDSSRQHAQALQFLGLLQPVVKASALGDVPPEDRQAVFGRIGVHFKPDIEGRVMLFEMHEHAVFHRAVQLGVRGACWRCPGNRSHTFLPRISARGIRLNSVALSLT